MKLREQELVIGTADYRLYLGFDFEDRTAFLVTSDGIEETWIGVFTPNMLLGDGWVTKQLEAWLLPFDLHPFVEKAMTTYMEAARRRLREAATVEANRLNSLAMHSALHTIVKNGQATLRDVMREQGLAEPYARRALETLLTQGTITQGGNLYFPASEKSYG